MQDLPYSFGVQYIRRAGANVEESEKFLCPVCVFYVPDTAAKKAGSISLLPANLDKDLIVNFTTAPFHAQKWLL